MFPIWPTSWTLAERKDCKRGFIYGRPRAAIPFGHHGSLSSIGNFTFLCDNFGDHNKNLSVLWYLCMQDILKYILFVLRFILSDTMNNRCIGSFLWNSCWRPAMWTFHPRWWNPWTTVPLRSLSSTHILFNGHTVILFLTHIVLRRRGWRLNLIIAFRHEERILVFLLLGIFHFQMLFYH